MTSDVHFQGKVKEEMLIRLLDAFVWKSQAEEDGQVRFSNVQGGSSRVSSGFCVSLTDVHVLSYLF